MKQAEKEAKRLRRVLANRESARQTILRRQAIRDELARKVADLSSQNENMKKVLTPQPAPRSSSTSVCYDDVVVDLHTLFEFFYFLLISDVS